MKPRHKRLALIGGIVAAVGVATALVLNAFQSNSGVLLLAIAGGGQRGAAEPHVSASAGW